MTRVSGHTLVREGAAHTGQGQLVVWPDGRRSGRGKCSCGELSSILESDRARKNWHRVHKADVERQQRLEDE